MLLRVKNLGPVREAELDLGKPLIVLTGPNNSGKTYLAWAAYSLARLDVTKVEPPPSLLAWVDRLLAADGQRLDLDTLLAIQDDVLRALAQAAKDRLPDDFAAPRDRFDETRLELSPPSGDEDAMLGLRGVRNLTSGRYILNLFLASDGLRFDVVDLQIGAANKSVSVESIQGDELTALKRGFATIATSLVMSMSLNRNWMAFPVERLAINLFAHELAAKRTELVDELLLENRPISPPALHRRASSYPRVIRDALQEAIYGFVRSEPGPYADIADELEAKVLGGKVELTAHDELRFIPSQGTKRVSLGLHESASVVKSLVSLVLHLRYAAQPGQRLVIDEPELNLHPDNQRLVTRILAKAINRGLKIMMSTHSDYVLRELNNLVMLGQDSDEARTLVQELGYDADQTLCPDQIGAYLVNGGECNRLEVTETGFETATIEEEIHKLNHDAQTIYLRLFCD